MTTCPSGVNYMHLVDHARHRIETTFKRPWLDRVLRRAAWRRPAAARAVSRCAAGGASGARPSPGFCPPVEGRAGARAGEPAQASPLDRPQSSRARDARPGAWRCSTVARRQVLAPEINEATIRLLTRHGCEVVVAEGAGCCGALTHHLGQDGHAFARANILAWTREIERGGLDAIVINASGCGTTVKDYGFMFRNDPDLAAPAAAVSRLARDITELMSDIGLRAAARPRPGGASPTTAPARCSTASAFATSRRRS